MGVADFPIEILRLIKIAPKDDASAESGMSFKMIYLYQRFCLTFVPSCSECD